MHAPRTLRTSIVAAGAATAPARNRPRGTPSPPPPPSPDTTLQPAARPTSPADDALRPDPTP
jgi:hypothetical protein